MRTTDTMTISMPSGMAKQMEKVQHEEHRTRSELIREAWRQYFENRYGAYTPTQAEAIAIKKGRAEFKRGEHITLRQLHTELESARHKIRKKRTRKSS